MKKRKITKERKRMMKYKVGDRVKVRSDLTLSELYDGYWAFDEMIKKNIATITFVHDDHYEIKEDDFYISTGQIKCLKD